MFKFINTSTAEYFNEKKYNIDMINKLKKHLF